MMDWTRGIEKSNDIAGLAQLERVLSSELNKLTRYEDSRKHLKVLSASGGVTDETRWSAWPKAKLSVRFANLPAVSAQKELRSWFKDGTVSINTAHSDFVIRVGPDRKVDERLIGYSAVLAVAHYLRYTETGSSWRDESGADLLDRTIRLTSSLEDAVIRRYFRKT